MVFCLWVYGIEGWVVYTFILFCSILFHLVFGVQRLGIGDGLVGCLIDGIEVFLGFCDTDIWGCDCEGVWGREM